MPYLLHFCSYFFPVPPPVASPDPGSQGVGRSPPLGGFNKEAWFDLDRLIPTQTKIFRPTRFKPAHRWFLRPPPPAPLWLVRVQPPAATRPVTGLICLPVTPFIQNCFSRPHGRLGLIKGPGRLHWGRVGVVLSLVVFTVHFCVFNLPSVFPTHDVNI